VLKFRWKRQQEEGVYSTVSYCEIEEGHIPYKFITVHCHNYSIFYYCSSLTMPNFYIKPYHVHLCIGKNMAYIQFAVVSGIHWGS
jgi:hypothetical protein